MIKSVLLKIAFSVAIICTGSWQKAFIGNQTLTVTDPDLGLLTFTRMDVYKQTGLIALAGWS